MFFNRSLLLVTLIASVIIALSGCGGGDDGDSTAARDVVPAGAKICELRQSAASVSIVPAVEMYDDPRVTTPEVRPAGDDEFVVTYPFAPGSLPYPLPDATLTFLVRQPGYHVRAETPLWGCALEGLTAGDRVVIRGGPRNQTDDFSVAVRAEVTLDGKRVASKWDGFWIYY